MAATAVASSSSSAAAPSPSTENVRHQIEANRKLVDAISRRRRLKLAQDLRKKQQERRRAIEKTAGGRQALGDTDAAAMGGVTAVEDPLFYKRILDPTELFRRVVLMSSAGVGFSNRKLGIRYMNDDELAAGHVSDGKEGSSGGRRRHKTPRSLTFTTPPLKVEYAKLHSVGTIGQFTNSPGDCRYMIILATGKFTDKEASEYLRAARKVAGEQARSIHVVQKEFFEYLERAVTYLYRKMWMDQTVTEDQRNEYKKTATALVTATFLPKLIRKKNKALKAAARGKPYQKIIPSEYEMTPEEQAEFDRQVDEHAFAEYCEKAMRPEVVPKEMPESEEEQARMADVRLIAATKKCFPYAEKKPDWSLAQTRICPKEVIKTEVKEKNRPYHEVYKEIAEKCMRAAAELNVAHEIIDYRDHLSRPIPAFERRPHTEPCIGKASNVRLTLTLSASDLSNGKYGVKASFGKRIQVLKVANERTSASEMAASSYGEVDLKPIENQFEEETDAGADDQTQKKDPAMVVDAPVKKMKDDGDAPPFSSSPSSIGINGEVSTITTCDADANLKPDLAHSQDLPGSAEGGDDYGSGSDSSGGDHSSGDDYSSDDGGGASSSSSSKPGSLSSRLLGKRSATGARSTRQSKRART